MSFKRNTAVTGFPFTMLSAATGAATAGLTVTARIIKDGGAQATVAGSVADKGNGQYSVNLTATEMNAAVIGLLFTAVAAVPASFTIKTVMLDLDEPIRAGMSALPNVAPGDSGGLPTVDSNNFIAGVYGDIQGNVDGRVLGGGIATFAGYGVAATGDLAAEHVLAQQDSLEALQTDVTAIIGHTGTSGVVVASASKSGYALSATGLDAIGVNAPAGVAATFPQMLVQLWRRFFRKSTLTATQLKTYADDGTTVLTTQTVADDSQTQTQGPAA